MYVAEVVVSCTNQRATVYAGHPIHDSASLQSRPVPKRSVYRPIARLARGIDLQAYILLVCTDVLRGLRILLISYSRGLSP